MSGPQQIGCCRDDEPGLGSRSVALPAFTGGGSGLPDPPPAFQLLSESIRGRAFYRERITLSLNAQHNIVNKKLRKTEDEMREK
jgi:hypothetical protein